MRATAAYAKKSEATGELSTAPKAPLKSGTIQAKLTVGQPDDIYEQEADRLADRVMRMTDESLVQRQTGCPGCEEELVQAKSASLQTPAVTSGIESSINSLKGGGSPLPESTRSFFEQRFGTDFSNVSVHSNDRAAQTAQSINAKAYTIGNNIAFNYGQYSPDTNPGKRLLAHELTHVVQQRINYIPSNPVIQRFTEKQHKAIEDEALSGTNYSDKERKQIELGNWQNDFNQISLIKDGLRDILKEAIGDPIANAIVTQISQDTFFKIAKIVAEAKFGEDVASQMTKERFGKYNPEQHFDNPNKGEECLEDSAVPAYIKKTIEGIHKTLKLATNPNTDPDAQKEYYGSALHVIEDFFAHTNFVEVALNILGYNVNTYGGIIETGEDIGKYRLVSGIFDDLDTWISVLTMMKEALEGKKGEKQRPPTTVDKIVMVILEDVTDWLPGLYEGVIVTMYDIKKALTPEVVENLIENIIEPIKGKIIDAINSRIDDLKKEMEKDTGTNIYEQPSHSQVNKDVPDRKHFQIARKLAVFVVRKIDCKIYPIWRSFEMDDDFEKKQTEMLAEVDKYLSSPYEDTWWIEIVATEMKKKSSKKREKIKSKGQKKSKTKAKKKASKEKVRKGKKKTHKKYLLVKIVNEEKQKVRLIEGSPENWNDTSRYKLISPGTKGIVLKKSADEKKRWPWPKWVKIKVINGKHKKEIGWVSGIFVKQLNKKKTGKKSKSKTKSFKRFKWKIVNPKGLKVRLVDHPSNWDNKKHYKLLSPGTDVMLLKVSNKDNKNWNDWKKVRVINGPLKGKRGWVMKIFIKASK